LIVAAFDEKAEDAASGLAFAYTEENSVCRSEETCR
jgi:hypothetical protein